MLGTPTAIDFHAMAFHGSSPFFTYAVIYMLVFTVCIHVSFTLSTYLSLSAYLSIYLSIYFSIYLYIYISLSLSLSFCLSILIPQQAMCCWCRCEEKMPHSCLCPCWASIETYLCLSPYRFDIWGSTYSCAHMYLYTIVLLFVYMDAWVLPTMYVCV